MSCRSLRSLCPPWRIRVKCPPVQMFAPVCFITMRTRRVKWQQHFYVVADVFGRAVDCTHRTVRKPAEWQPTGWVFEWMSDWQPDCPTVYSPASYAWFVLRFPCFFAFIISCFNVDDYFSAIIAWKSKIWYSRPTVHLDIRLFGYGAERKSWPHVHLFNKKTRDKHVVKLRLMWLMCGKEFNFSRQRNFIKRAQFIWVVSFVFGLNTNLRFVLKLCMTVGVFKLASN